MDPSKHTRSSATSTVGTVAPNNPTKPQRRRKRERMPWDDESASQGSEAYDDEDSLMEDALRTTMRTSDTASFDRHRTIPVECVPDFTGGGEYSTATFSESKRLGPTKPLTQPPLGPEWLSRRSKMSSGTSPPAPESPTEHGAAETMKSNAKATRGANASPTETDANARKRDPESTTSSEKRCGRQYAIPTIPLLANLKGAQDKQNGRHSTLNSEKDHRVCSVLSDETSMSVKELRIFFEEKSVSDRPSSRTSFRSESASDWIKRIQSGGASRNVTPKPSPRIAGTGSNENGPKQFPQFARPSTTPCNSPAAQLIHMALQQSNSQNKFQMANNSSGSELLFGGFGMDAVAHRPSTKTNESSPTSPPAYGLPTVPPTNATRSSPQRSFPAEPRDSSPLVPFNNPIRTMSLKDSTNTTAGIARQLSHFNRYYSTPDKKNDKEQVQAPSAATATPTSRKNSAAAENPFYTRYLNDKEHVRASVYNSRGQISRPSSRRPSIVCMESFVSQNMMMPKRPPTDLGGSIPFGQQQNVPRPHSNLEGSTRVPQPPRRQSANPTSPSLQRSFPGRVDTPHQLHLDEKNFTSKPMTPTGRQSAVTTAPLALSSKKGDENAVSPNNASGTTANEAIMSHSPEFLTDTFERNADEGTPRAGASTTVKITPKKLTLVPAASTPNQAFLPLGNAAFREKEDGSSGSDRAVMPLRGLAVSSTPTPWDVNNRSASPSGVFRPKILPTSSPPLFGISSGYQVPSSRQSGFFGSALPGKASEIDGIKNVESPSVSSSSSRSSSNSTFSSVSDDSSTINTKKNSSDKKSGANINMNRARRWRDLIRKPAGRDEEPSYEGSGDDEQERSKAAKMDPVVQSGFAGGLEDGKTNDRAKQTDNGSDNLGLGPVLTSPFKRNDSISPIKSPAPLSASLQRTGNNSISNSGISASRKNSLQPDVRNSFQPSYTETTSTGMRSDETTNCAVVQRKTHQFFQVSTHGTLDSNSIGSETKTENTKAPQKQQGQQQQNQLHDADYVAFRGRSTSEVVLPPFHTSTPHMENSRRGMHAHPNSTTLSSSNGSPKERSQSAFVRAYNEGASRGSPSVRDGNGADRRTAGIPPSESTVEIDPFLTSPTTRKSAWELQTNSTMPSKFSEANSVDLGQRKNDMDHPIQTDSPALPSLAPMSLRTDFYMWGSESKNSVSKPLLDALATRGGIPLPTPLPAQSSLYRSENNKCESSAHEKEAPLSISRGRTSMTDEGYFDNKESINYSAGGWIRSREASTEWTDEYYKFVCDGYDHLTDSVNDAPSTPGRPPSVLKPTLSVHASNLNTVFPMNTNNLQQGADDTISSVSLVDASKNCAAAVESGTLGTDSVTLETIGQTDLDDEHGLATFSSSSSSMVSYHQESTLPSTELGYAVGDDYSMEITPSASRARHPESDDEPQQTAYSPVLNEPQKHTAPRSAESSGTRSEIDMTRTPDKSAAPLFTLAPIKNLSLSSNGRQTEMTSDTVFQYANGTQGESDMKLAPVSVSESSVYVLPTIAFKTMTAAPLEVRGQGNNLIVKQPPGRQ